MTALSEETLATSALSGQPRAGTPSLWAAVHTKRGVDLLKTKDD